MIFCLFFNPFLPVYVISPLFFRILLIDNNRLASYIYDTLLVFPLLLHLQIHIIVNYDISLFIIRSLRNGLNGRDVVESYRANF